MSTMQRRRHKTVLLFVLSTRSNRIIIIIIIIIIIKIMFNDLLVIPYEMGMRIGLSYTALMTERQRRWLFPSTVSQIGLK